MKLFEIALPLNDNKGTPYSHAHLEWQSFALRRAGGYTRMPVADGVWMDPKTGETYSEPMQGYRVACDAGTFATLVHFAKELFPDQIAFFIATIGDARIIERNAPLSEVA